MFKKRKHFLTIYAMPDPAISTGPITRDRTGAHGTSVLAFPVVC